MKAGCTQSSIAREIGVHKSIVSRELRRKRYGRCCDRRGQLRDCVGIDERPDITGHKQRYGDWEADTIIISKGGRQVIVSLTGRKSKLSLLVKADRKTAAEVTQAISDLLLPLKDRVHTHIRSRQGICASPADCIEVEGRLLFFPSLLCPGTRSERKHQRIGQAVFSEEA